MLLIGCGEMAVQHFRVLRALNVEPVVIGRGEMTAAKFTQITGWPVASLGLDDFLARNPPTADLAIVAVDTENLAGVCLSLLKSGVRRLLVEKPGALSPRDLAAVAKLGHELGGCVWIAYNRRFYNATNAARDIIDEDGGIVSCHFDFTEWSHQIEGLTISDDVKQRWVVANSSHVIDLVFHLIGSPAMLTPVTTGATPWHSAGAIFVGHGISDRGIPFSYHANWNGPGRWLCEFITSRSKLIFQPLEALSVIKRGSIVVTPVAAPDDLDERYKAGVYRQDRDFIDQRESYLCSIAEQLVHWRFYDRIANYGS